MYNGKYFTFNDFSGGDCSALLDTTLTANQASTCVNFFIYPDGKGLRPRGITIKANSSEFGTAADNFPVIGLGVLAKSDGTNHMLAIKKNKAFGSQIPSGGFTDRTGAVTITNAATTSGDRANRRYSFCTFGDLLICFGGGTTSAITPEAPFKWAGETNNIAALGGSPPTARFCFSAGNRVFAGSTSADPATLYWSIVGNAEDWTGSGSGSVVVGNLDDGQQLIGAAVLSHNVVLLFKSNSIYYLDLSTGAPFAPTLLMNGIGLHSVNALTVADGVCYFITQQRQLAMTDGSSVKRIPSNHAYLSVIIGPQYVYRMKSRGAYTEDYPEYDVIMITGYNSSGDVNYGYLTVGYDLINKCWLTMTGGYNFSSVASHDGGYVYGGAGNVGYVYIPEYQLPTTGSYIDQDSYASTGGAYTCTWESGALNPSVIDGIINPQTLSVVCERILGSTGISADLTLTIKFDNDTTGHAYNLTVPVEAQHQLIRTRLYGRGNTMKWKISYSPSSFTTAITIHSVTVGGKVPAGHGSG